jgi:hypothetical protein
VHLLLRRRLDVQQRVDDVVDHAAQQHHGRDQEAVVLERVAHKELHERHGHHHPKRDAQQERKGRVRGLHQDLRGAGARRSARDTAEPASAPHADGMGGCQKSRGQKSSRGHVLCDTAPTTTTHRQHGADGCRQAGDRGQRQRVQLLLREQQHRILCATQCRALVTMMHLLGAAFRRRWLLGSGLCWWLVAGVIWIRDSNATHVECVQLASGRCFPLMQRAQTAHIQ